MKQWKNIKTGQLRVVTTDSACALAPGTKVLVGSVRPQKYLAELFWLGGNRIWTTFDWILSCTRELPEEK